MSKWKKHTVYDANGTPVFQFHAKKIRKGKSLQRKQETQAIGFQPPEYSNVCRCGS